jgi:hypothetical protein
MSVFFNGRLYTTPTTASAVNDSALANQSLSTGNNIAIVGPSSGGVPNTPLVYGSPSAAIAGLISGDLLTAVLKAFNPSNQTNGPAQVTAIRVNPAVQSTLNLLDVTTAVAIVLSSSDYGQYTGGVNIAIAGASVTGLKVTVSLGQNYFTQDNITRTLLQVQYSGAFPSASMTISGTALTLYAPAGTPIATISFATYTTITAVVAAINAVAGFSASVQGGNGALASANGFDYVTAVDVRTAPYNALAVLQAVIDWINSPASNYVTASRPANAGLPPSPLAATYLSGGSDGVVTNTNYANAYTVLQTLDVQWVVPATSSASVHAMNDAHCQFMSTVGQSERRGIVGMALGSTDAQAIAEALGLNSDRTGLVHLGFYDYSLSGVWTLYPAYITAALVAGGFAGSAPGTPMTNKSLTMRGIERVLQVPSATDPLILGGVIPIQQTTIGYKVVKSVSTWLANTNFNRVELSTGAAMDYVARSARAALDVLRGQAGSPVILARALSITDSTLRLLAVAPPTGPGCIVGDAVNPAFKNITASLVGDVLQVSFQCSPVIPVNYVMITIYAQPYSGSISGAIAA